MSNPSNTDPASGVPDLGDLKARADAAKEAAAELKEREDNARIQRVAASWDRNMQRAFKGIMRRDVRHRYLSRGLEA